MKIQLKTWDEVRDWVDRNLMIHPSYMCEAVKEIYPRDAFSLGQFASKAWLVNKLQTFNPRRNKRPVVALLGCWIGAIVPFLHRSLVLERIYGFDMDPVAIDLSEQFNRKHVELEWKYKGVVMDIGYQPTNWMQFETGGELIQVKPDWLINTSCEHMDTHWFDTADSDQLIIMQSNNNAIIEGHINPCENLEDFTNKYLLSKVLYAGEMELPTYTRYMQIGYK